MKLSIKSSFTTKKFVYRKKKSKKQQQPTELDEYELTLDYISDDETTIFIPGNKINFDLIKLLPKLLKDATNDNEITSLDIDDDEIQHNSIKSINNDYINSLDLDDDDEFHNNSIKATDNDNDIDFESIVKDTVGGKIVFYDYTKNLIYNSKYVVIGSINEDGEIYLEETEENAKIVQELEKSNTLV